MISIHSEEYRGYHLSIVQDNEVFHFAIMRNESDPDMGDRVHTSLKTARIHAKRLIDLYYVEAAAMQQYDEMLSSGIITQEQYRKEVEWFSAVVRDARSELAKGFAPDSPG